MLGIEIPQLREHLFGQAIAQIFLARIAGEILKGQYCEHDSACVRGWGERSRPEIPNTESDSEQDRCCQKQSGKGEVSHRKRGFGGTCRRVCRGAYLGPRWLFRSV